MKWAYGVTTVPGRRDSYLPRTLRSLAAAGFDAPRLFVDGDASLTGYGVPTSQVSGRCPAVGTLGGWVLALWELMFRCPTADRFAIFQDDLEAVRGLREYLEAVTYPPDGYLNLYTAPPNEPGNGYGLKIPPHGFYPSNQMGKGALALVFSNEAARVLLSSRFLADRPLDVGSKTQAVDYAVVMCMNRANWAEWVHNPSLVQHVGLLSAMKHIFREPSATFPGEDFDARTLLK